MTKARKRATPARREAPPAGTKPTKAAEQKHPVLELQEKAGNAAVVHLMRQLAPPEDRVHLPGGGLMEGFGPLAAPPLVSVDEGTGTTPASIVDGPVSYPDEPYDDPALPEPDPATEAAALADRTRKINFARTTLSRIEPLSKKDEALLRKAIPATPIFGMVINRNTAGRIVRDLTLKLDYEQNGPAHPDEQGQLVSHPTADLEAELEHWIAEFETRTVEVQGAMAGVGVSSEAELTKLVDEQFPTMFLDRAETIAYAVLDENEQVVLTEAARLGLDFPGSEAGVYDPMATFGMREAAKELANMQEVFGASMASLEDFQEAEAEASKKDAEAQAKGEPAGGDEFLRMFRLRRDQLGLKYPLLLRVWDYFALSRMPDKEIEDFSGETFRQILSDIQDTRHNIKEGDLKTWKLRNVFDMTMQDLGITAESPLYRSVEWRVDKEENDKSILDKAIMAIGLTAAILAALPSAGTSLVIAGTAIAVSAGVYQLSQSVGNYYMEKSAENVAIDPRLADISTGSPDLWAVALDLVGLGLDVGDVVKAIGLLGKEIRAARASGELKALIDAATEIPEVGAKGAETIARRVAREADVDASLSRVITAVGERFTAGDLARIEEELVKLGDEALRLGWEDLKVAGKIRPMNVQTLAEFFSLAEIESRGMLKKSGMYSREHGILFITGDRTVASLSSATIHEVTHYLQNIYRPSMGKFWREFEAYSKQRQYILRLMQDGVDPETFPGWRWLATASDDDIVAHIKMVDNVVPPARFEFQAAVEDALHRIDRVDFQPNVVGLDPE